METVQVAQDKSQPRPFTEGSGRVRLPELLAPAGDWECAKAAVENGADAIYFGLEKFNARIRAHNFTEADLPRLMEFLHRRGVKGYVTFNTLVFQNEWEQAKEYIRTMIAAGVDAAIVQDVGICRLIRQLSPDFPIHVSTQMTITSAAGVEFARELGCNLVVLARECSLKEIEKIQRECQVSSVKNQSEHGKEPVSFTPDICHFPLEVFVHGALCVAYSGQCLTSEALGGRSANRGECAQACRMPYDLIADGKQVALGDRRYLLSPQDLAGLEVLPGLARLGVASLKIEGRLKAPEYVASITRIYRNALNSLDISALGDFERSERANSSPPEEREKARLGGDRTEETVTLHPAQKPPFPAADAQYEMEMAFSRGLSTGWFRGINNQELVHARFGKKRGVYLGQVSRVQGDRVHLKLEGPLKAGDGIVFDAGHPEEKEEGARVYKVEIFEEGRSGKSPRPGEIRKTAKPVGTALRTAHTPLKQGVNERVHNRPEAALNFGRGDVDFNRIHVGDKVWKTSDPELDQRLAKTFGGDTPRFQRPITLTVHGISGQPLSVIAKDELGHIVKVESTMSLVAAQKHPLTTERLCDQLGRLGGTPFKLGSLDNYLEGQLLIPISELNRLRREIVEHLLRQRSQAPRWKREVKAEKCEPKGIPSPQASLHKPRLIVLVRNLAQLQAVIESGIETIYCEFEDPKKYRDAVSLFRESAISDRPSAIYVAPPRIFKMGEEWTLKQVLSSEAHGYLVRNYDHLRFFENYRRVGDFSLNVANRLTADYFKNKYGLERVTASYDLNYQQLEALLKAAPPEWFEVTIHQHIPMFHMEHCVFCAFLSKGTDYSNCGRPCDKHDLKLRDRVGAEHPVKADVGCRNTVFNALAQTGAEHVPALIDLGVRNFRLEFLNEPPEMVAKTIDRYRALLRGEISGAQLWRELKLLNQLGVTRGQM